MRVGDIRTRLFSQYWNQLSFRFPILIVLFSFLVGLTVGAVALYVANGGLIDSYKDNMTVLRNERSRAITTEIEIKARLLETFAHAPVGLNGLKEFGKAFRELGAQRDAVIKAYTDDNRFARDNRIALTDAGDSSAYTQVHKVAHRPIAYIVQLNKLYDILLIDLNGDIVYTAKKERDFGANVLRGPLKDELVGELYRKALSNSSPPVPVMADLRRYAPSDDKPTLMMARALQDASGEITGVAIFQIDSNTEMLSAAANNTLNLGETGEVELVGDDLLMRSDSRFSKGMTLEQKVDTYSPRRALAGLDGVEVTTDYRGHEVISAFGPLDVMGVHWAVIAKIDLAEVQAPIRKIAILLFAGALASIAVIGSIGYAVTRSVSRPLKGAIAVLDQLTAGNHGVEVSFDEHVHEMRAIGNGLRTFKEGLIKTNALMIEVQKNQAQLTSLLDSSPTGVIVLADNNEVLFANDPATYLLGIDKSALIGRTFSFVEIAVTQADARRMITMARQEGAVRGVELTVRVPEKSDAILNVSVRRTSYLSKEAYLIWFYDITEQKRLQTEIEKALADSKTERARTEAILAGAPDPIVIVRADSVIEYANIQIEKVLGYAPQELVGQKIERLLPERYRNGHTSQVRGFFETGRARAMGAGRDLFALSKDGREVPVEISLSPVQAGDRSVVVAALRDVTTQKAAASELRESQQLLSGVIQNSATVIFVKREGRYVMVNKAWETLTGISAERARDKTDLEVFDEAAAQRIMANDAAVIASRAPAEYEEMVKTGGRTIHFLSLKFPFFNAKGEVDGLCGMSTDITDRIAAEKAVREAKEIAEAATKAKSDFLASMSHEIRTPMNGITGMADVLAQTNLDDEQKHMLRTIRESGNALITVINDILDFSKIEAGKLDLESVTMSIVDAVEGVATTLTPTAVKKGVRVHVFVDPDLPAAVHGDPTRLRQIMFNLTGNAVKFSNGRDVQIRVLPGGRSDDQRTWVRFSVIDNGIGISPENQAKLFQAFSQAESSTTRKFGGTGLGLAICKRLTEMMGGTIGVESQEGQGSTFWVELPFQKAAEAKTNQKDRDLRGLRVLLVGSEGPREQAITTYIKHWGADIGTAKDAAAATALLTDKTKGAFDSVILDLGLDGERQDRAMADLRKSVKKNTMIVLQDYQNRGARIIDKDVVSVDVNPLVRYRIISAVAVAAGRASPEIKTENDAAKFQPVKAPSAAEALASGQLILLAEDNLTNQDVIRRQLNLVGYTCETAANGVEAFKAYQTGRYALLLTDCHMPEMDGYELTGRIRSVERGSGHRLPIVAVTANALQGEAERCLAAGMDDYVSKPIAMPALVAALRKWMPPPRASANSAAPPQDIIIGKIESAKPPKSKAKRDSRVIDERAIKDTFGDDEETFKEILISFIEPSRDIVSDLLAALQQRTAVSVKDAAHKLKSSARTVGANDLADTCVALEAAGKKADWATIEALVPKARDQFEAVEAYVESV